MRNNKYYLLFSEGSVVNQVICAVIINLPVFAYGASIGWMSPMSLLLQSENTPTALPLTDSQISWIAAAAYVICIPSVFLVAILGDNMGRKKTLLLVSAACGGTWIALLSSLSMWSFILARVLVGFSMAGAYVACPLYTKEISQDFIRGFLGSLVILFHTMGNLFLYVVGDYLGYRTILWICLSIPTIHLVLFMMMPESPSYLVKRKKYDEAKRSLAWLRCREEDDPAIITEVDMLKKEQELDQESSKFALKAILKDKILSRAFRIAIVVTLAREVCGAIPVLNFAGDIFAMSSEGSGLLLSPNQQAMMLGAVQVVGSMLASSIVEKAGRKMLLLVSSFVLGVSMCALASWFLAKQFGFTAPAWLPIVLLCICIFSDSAGLGPISVVVTTEIFSFKFRGPVIAMTMATASLADFLQMLFFKPLATAVGIHAAFYFFGGICLLTTLYVIFFVPETKNRSLLEIYEDLRPKNKKVLKNVVRNAS